MTAFDFNPYYKVEGYEGIAWDVIGHAKMQVESPYIDDEYCHYMVNDPDRVIAIMVGDDRQFDFGIDELTKISDDDFCNSCGQIGCGH